MPDSFLNQALDLERGQNMSELSRNALNPRKRKIDLLPIALLALPVVVVLVVMVIPLLYGIFMTFFDYRIGTKPTMEQFIGIGNYARIIKDPVMWKSVKNTVLFTIFATGGELVIGTIFAVLLLRINLFFSKFLRAMFTIPLLISPVVIGLVWRYMYDPYSGIIYWVLKFFNIGLAEFPGVTGQATALFTVITTHWWQITPYVLIIVTAGIVSIPAELYEAARIDGASETKSFFKITLPLLKNVYMVIFITSGVGSIMVFDLIYALTQGGPANSSISTSMYAYQNAFELSQMGYAMTIAIITVVLSFVIFGIPFIKYNTATDGGER